MADFRTQFVDVCGGMYVLMVHCSCDKNFFKFLSLLKVPAKKFPFSMTSWIVLDYKTFEPQIWQS
jgi:hypothetical protein